MTDIQPLPPVTPPLDGFILTRHGRDVQGRTEIVMWLWSTQGPVRGVVPVQEPGFFLPWSLYHSEAADDASPCHFRSCRH
uniref:hypothetical protein n=1 Tax=Aeromonas caviae TaxID=648 RepID=UPI0025B6F821